MVIVVIVSCSVNLFFIATLVWLLAVQKAERKDLYNRIMAQDLAQYKLYEAKDTKPIRTKSFLNKRGV